MAEIPPAGPGRSHGSELADPRHAAALGTAIRYHTAAGMAAQRALRTFLAHRKAVKDGLVDAAGRSRRPRDGGRARQSELHERIPSRHARSPSRQHRSRANPGVPGLAVVARAADRGDATTRNFLDSDDGVDDATWLAGVPVVEAEPEREAERRRALMRIKFRQVRRLFGAAPWPGSRSTWSAPTRSPTRNGSPASPSRRATRRKA